MLRPVPPARSHNISRVVHAVKRFIPGWHGKVTCGAKIDEHGHVRDVDVKGSTDESIIKPIRAALINWEYEPAAIKEASYRTCPIRA